MSIWFAIPSKRPLWEVPSVLTAWKDQGYNVAVLREPADGRPSQADLCLPTSEYQGWARSVNVLVGVIMAMDTDAQWIVTGGDDYWPDPNKRADEIAAECIKHFDATFGVMQPTGDRWAEGSCTTCGSSGQVVHSTDIINGKLSTSNVLCPDCHGTGRSAVIDRICGSPWLGREFCRRMYNGSGPMFNGYYHNFADEELQHVARRLGVLWQRRDLNQEHRHWARQQPFQSGVHTGLGGDVRNRPHWAEKINCPKKSDWVYSQALFNKRRAAGFPGHEPLER